MTRWDEFETDEIETGDARIFCRHAGSGPLVVLLHGFPETHLMWRDIAPILAERFSVACLDLRGYGRSSCPGTAPDHSPYSKRAMAADIVGVAAKFGFQRFAVAGHDRGARVAYRLALDHPEAVERLALLDIVPTLEAWELADDKFALSFWPWTLLAQPAPLPERLIAADPEAIIDDALAQWGSDSRTFTPEIRAAYIDALRDPARIHAICEEYRAAADLDRTLDLADRSVGRRIACPVLALWSASGALETWYASAGGPLALWRCWAWSIEGEAVPGGHFFPEEHPEQTAARLAAFLG